MMRNLLAKGETQGGRAASTVIGLLPCEEETGEQQFGVLGGIGM
jgi:hypothetical protein